MNYSASIESEKGALDANRNRSNPAAPAAGIANHPSIKVDLVVVVQDGPRTETDTSYGRLHLLAPQRNPGNDPRQGRLMLADTAADAFEALATIGLAAERYLREHGNETAVTLHMRRILRNALDGLTVVEAELAQQRRAA